MPSISSGPLIQELAAPGADFLNAYVGEVLPNPDAVLASLGGDLLRYEQLLSDHEVQAAWQQRRDAVIACEWEVTPGGSAKADQIAADALKEQLSALGWDRATRRMLSGVFYGFAVGECLWAMDDGRVVLEDVRVRKPHRFVFDRDRRLRLLRASEPSGIVMPERKFWHFSAGADDDDSPYGRGLAHWLWWPVFFRRNGAKFWATFLDKFGSPSTKATYPNNATQEEKDKALAAAHALRSESAVAMPEGFDVQLIEAAAAGKASHQSFVGYWDNAITKIILSQTGTSNAGPYVGTAQAHRRVRLDIIKSDADLICESFNSGPARWLTEWNFPNAAVPQVWRRISDAEETEAGIDRDSKLYQMGLEMTDDAVRDRYGEGWVKQTKPRNEAASFAEKTPTKEGEADADLDDPGELASQLDEVAAPSMDALINSVRELVMDKNVADLAELEQRLATAYPDIDVSDLARVFGDAFALAELQGRDGVNDGR